MTSIFLSLLLAAPLGGISGDLRLGDDYLADVKVTLTCGEASAETTTDAKGSFRLSIKGEGKCRLTVDYDGQTPGVDVVVFAKPARYRLVLVKEDDAYLLKRV